MEKVELVNKLEEIKNQLRDIMKDDSTTDYTSIEFDNNLMNSIKFLKSAIKEIK